MVRAVFLSLRGFPVFGDMGLSGSEEEKVEEEGDKTPNGGRIP